MMTTLYTRLHGVATRLIKKYGYNNVLYNRQIFPNNKWDSEFEMQSYMVDMLILPSGKYSRETMLLQGEKAMLDTNYVAYMPYTNFIPTINDSITTGNITYTIVSIVRINPNGTDVLFKLELK